MLTQSDILAYLSDHKPEFRKRFKIVKIGLFGSFARNEQREGSDIDLIVEFEPNTADLTDKKAALREMLHKRFSTEVDVCREKYIKPFYREQILKNVIYV